MGVDSASVMTVVVIRTSSVARLESYRRAVSELPVQLVMVHPVVRAEFSGVVRHWVVSETTDVDAVERALRGAMSAHGFRPDAIVSFDEYGVYCAAVLSGRFGLRAFPLAPEALARTSIKSRFREWCEQHAIRSPRSVALHAPSDLARVPGAGLTFPVVAKPSPGAGKLAARKCGSLRELAAHCELMWQIFAAQPEACKQLTGAMGCAMHILVEEYIGGQEVDLDCLVEQGRVRFCAVSDNFETAPPFFAETGGLTPSALPEPAQAALRELLERFVASHGDALTGVLHFEAKYDFERQAAFVIEVNCRMGNAETREMVWGAYGVDLGEQFLRLALGLPLDPRALPAVSAPRMRCASVNVYPPALGTLLAQRLDAEDPDLVAHSLSLKPGDAVADTRTMVAWIVAKGHDADSAVRAIRHITRQYERSLLVAPPRQAPSRPNMRAISPAPPGQADAYPANATALQALL